jgi:hypothetical protein
MVRDRHHRRYRPNERWHFAERSHQRRDARDLACQSAPKFNPRIAASANVTLMARIRGRLIGRAMTNPNRNAIANAWMGASRVAELTRSSHVRRGLIGKVPGHAADRIHGVVNPLYVAFGRRADIVICHEG